MISINKSLQDKIKQLVDISITLLNWSEAYKKLYEKYKPVDVLLANEFATKPIPTLLRFQSSMLFFDVLLNLNSLLSTLNKDKNKKEISFFELLELLPDSAEKNQILNQINNAIKKFQDNKLDKFRHKFVSHKDSSTNFDPVIMYLNFPNPDLFKICKEIIISLDSICHNFFNCYTNNIFNQLYEKSNKEYLSLIEKSLNETKTSNK